MLFAKYLPFFSRVQWVNEPMSTYVSWHYFHARLDMGYVLLCRGWAAWHHTLGGKHCAWEEVPWHRETGVSTWLNSTWSHVTSTESCDNTRIIAWGIQWKAVAWNMRIYWNIKRKLLHSLGCFAWGYVIIGLDKLLLLCSPFFCTIVWN